MKVGSKRKLRQVLSTLLVLAMLMGMPGLAALASEPTASARNNTTELRLWYDEPASQTVSTNDEGDRWQKATLPIGNGTIGAGIYGEIGTERLLLNEQTLWSGGPSELRPDYMGGNVISGKGENGATLKNIVSHYISTGNIIDTGKLTGLGAGTEWSTATGYGGYLPWGELNIATSGLTNTSTVTGYERWLSIDDALAGVRFTSGGVDYTREYLVSNPDNVMAAKVTASQSKTFTITMPSRQGGTTKAVNEDTLQLCGELSDNQLKYASFVKVVPGEGTTVTGSGNSLTVTGTEFTLFFSAATDYKQDYPVYRTGESDAELAKRVLKKTTDAAAKGYEAVRADHLTDYYSLYNRMHLDLGQAATTKTTDVLLSAYNNGTASESERRLLEVMLFQYGRYLTIASSRENSQLPSNLQGIWNYNDRAAWHSDFHTNVNLQMNYWPVYVTNLAESADPLIRYIDSLREPGRVTAKVYAGIESTEENPENGFMAHTQNTPWGWTCPGWSFNWGWAPAAIPWMLQNCWEHYEYTGDLDYMKYNIYPMMKEYCRLYDQLLVDLNTGKTADTLTGADTNVVLATIPAYSPEHGPATAGNTFEHTLVWQLYEDTITAANLLGLDSDKVGDENTPGTWAYNQAHLKGPIEIGTEGQIKEWYHEAGISKDENGNTIGEGYGHRHLSHMLGLFPGDLVQTNEEWVEAARVSMENRTFTSTGWGMGQRINTWARLRDGKNAYQLICNLFKNGMYVNLWDAHPPFQIDGNFGYTSGVAEMLMQSNMGFIDLMPALPNNWAEGSYSGLIARGNFELAAAWSSGSLDQVEIISHNGGECIVRYPNISRAVVKNGNNIVEFRIVDSDKIAFDSAKGQTYTITNIPTQSITVVEGAEALRTEENMVTVRWTGKEGVNYQVYRQIADGDILPLDGATTNPYEDTTAFESLGEIKYYIQEEGCKLSGAISVQDLRDMTRVDDQYSLDGTNSSGSPIVFGGTWGTYNSDAGNYKGTSRFVEARDVAGQTATLTFLGTGIQAMGKLNGYNTKFTMSIDGGAAQAFTASGSNGNNKVLGEITDLDYGIHTVVFTLVENKLDFDGFNVLGGQTTVDPPEELEINTVGGVEKLWNAGDTVQFTTNVEGATWTAVSDTTHATTCNYPDHKFSWNGEAQTLTAGLTDEVVTVTATKGGKSVSKDITITPKTTVTIVEDSVNGSAPNPAITWTGNWSSYNGESTKHHGGSKTESGTSYSYPFTGTGIAIFVQKNGHSSWSSNSYTVVLDEGQSSEQTITCSGYDASLSTSGVNQQKLVEFLDLENTSHTIKVTGTGTGVNLDFIEVYAPNPNAPTANIEALKAAVADAANYNQASYTEESWAPLAAVLTTAGQYLNNTVQATQEQVDALVSTIESAIADLVAKPLTAPENVKVLVTEGTAVTLTWDVVNGATGYIVTVNGTTEVATTVSTCRITGLESGKQYSFTVKATNDSQTPSSNSDTITATTLDTVVPTQPQNLVWDDANTLTWDASTDNVGVTGYKVLVNNVQQGGVEAATSKTLTISGTQNTLTVIAVDAAGNESLPATIVVAPTYTVTAANATVKNGQTKFKEGETVTATAIVPKGSVLTSWTATGVTLNAADKTAETITFSMPAGDVALTANVEEKNWSVTTNLNNLISDWAENDTVSNGDTLTLKLIAYAPYQLPTSVQVVMGGQQLQAPWVTYSVTDGTITVREVTGDVVITAENRPQTPNGSAFTEADPFQLPATKGASTKLEAEYMELVPANGSSLAAVYGPNFGNQQLTGFVAGDVIRLYYNAAQPGRYTLTLRYSSNRVANAAQNLNWSGEKVATHNGAVPSTLQDGQSAYGTTKLEFNVTQAGEGVVEFNANALATGAGDNGGPDIDSMTFTLEEISATQVSEIALNTTEAVLYLNGTADEATIQITATVTPDDATNKSVDWKSSDTSVVYVTQDGTVGARSNGAAIITATAMDNSGVEATAEITVKTRITGEVSISGQAKYGQQLVAAINQISHQDAKEGLTYQWNRNGQPIEKATDRHYTVTGEDIGAVLTVTVFAADPYVGAADGTTSAPVTATKTDGPPVVASLNAVDFTAAENGKITGLNPERVYEYKLVSAGDDAWADIPTNSIVFEVPAAGSYHVRVKETDTAFAGPVSSTLTILAADATGKAVQIGTFQGGVVRADVRKANAGDTVTLTVLPDEGYQLVAGSLKVNDGVVTVNSDGSFTMPDGEATVTAEFELKTYTITHDLINIGCDQEAHDHEAIHGSKPIITLRPQEGYDLPQVITVTVTETGAPFTYYTYTDGKIVFTGGISDNLTITGEGIKKSFNVVYALYGLSALDATRAVGYGEALSLTITAKDGYTLPSEITMTMNGEPFTDFTYSNGTVSIDAGKITGEVTITAEGKSNLPGLARVDVTGTAKVGQQLAAAVTPADAFPDYQWIRVDSEGNEFPIDGATNRSYVIKEADAGYRIKVAATGTSKYGGTVYSEPTEMVEDANVVPTTGVTLNQTTATITVGGNSLQLTATVQPNNASNKAVTWKSDDESIAFVTSNGAVSGRGLGTTTITATTVNGNKTATCRVTVVAVSLPTSVSVNVGRTTTIKATVPEDLPDKELTWSSADESIATVDENGVVTGVKAGKTTITVTTGDNYTATCTVTVSVPSSSSSSSTTTTETREDGATVTTVTKPDGSVTETVKQPDGTKTEAVTTKDGDKTITVIDASGEELAKVEIPAAIPAPETEFIDISSTPWAKEAINNVAGLKLVEGVGGNQYAPSVPMTRGALATVLHRFSQGKTDYETTFKDVAQGKYYTEGVTWAAKAKVVTGYTTDIFAPDDTITREQLAVMMARYAKLIGLDVTASADSLNAFVDGEKTGSWAVDGVAWCVEKGILLGKGGNTLDPNAKVTRAEVAVMLDRFIGMIK